MEKYKNLLFCFIASLLLGASCKKTKTEIPLTELEKLPPITQTGANTFGCLVDGVAWLPNGTKPQNGGPNIQVYVDPTFQGGAFYVTGHQYKNFQTKISFGSGGCTNGGFFDIALPFQALDYNRFNNSVNTCEFSSSDIGTYRRGFFNILRYDLTSGIFSGTFEFTIKSQSCGDSIKITNGRFDVKL